jgi:hypothetical protein
MSALGQKQTFERVRAMSALPPKADIVESDWNVRFVPKAEVEIQLEYCSMSVLVSLSGPARAESSPNTTKFAYGPTKSISFRRPTEGSYR